MKLGRLNDIGVATPDLDAAIARYRDIMGAAPDYVAPLATTTCHRG